MNSAAIKKSGRVFIVRPFGKKKNRQGGQIDFDQVEKELIVPAIEHSGFSGGSTGEFMQAGNIRVDMFRELLSADLVIADISIHNANAFYELGIRHALRDRYTVMIKANKNCDSHIFDLNSDRYLEYDPVQPAASLTKLNNVIAATLANEDGDSPVFGLLPGLESVDPEKVIVVPLQFREKVEQKSKDIEALTILSEEVTGKPWETSALRLIGKAQFKNNDHEGSAKTWERIRKFDMYDAEANQKLATNYQKLATKQQYDSELFMRSNQAAERALKFAKERARNNLVNF